MKRTVKFLAVNPDPRVQRAVLNAAHDSVYKSICNAFFHIAQNPEIKIKSPRHRKLFHQNQARIRKIISPNIPIRQKRNLIQKGGGLFISSIIPLALTTAIQLLGSTFVSKKKK